MLDVNERLNSLAGYDMRDVTTADSDETTLNGTLQLPLIPIPVESFTIVASRIFFRRRRLEKNFG
jgi:hypothetical protein